MRAKDVTGRTGEQVAHDWLVARGVQVLDRNWRCRHGELDLVGLEGETMVFVEVKTRRSLAFGHPVEAVTPVKLARLRRLAGLWLAAHEVRARQVRIDVVAVLLRAGAPPQVEHLRAVA